MRLDTNIKSKSLNNAYLNIIKKLFLLYIFYFLYNIEPRAWPLTKLTTPLSISNPRKRPLTELCHKLEVEVGLIKVETKTLD